MQWHKHIVLKMARIKNIYIMFATTFILFAVIYQFKLAHKVFTNTNENKLVVFRSAVRNENIRKHGDVHGNSTHDDVATDIRGHSHRIKKEVKHIAFLKVHKAGSSTIQNILYRLGLTRNLTFVLPVKGHYLSRSKYHYAKVLPLLTKEGQPWKYDILCNHAVFNLERFRHFMYPDAEYFAIVRQPLDLFLSAAYYYRYAWPAKYLTDINETIFIHSLLHHPEKYEPANVERSRTFNYMTRDFGFVLKSVDAVNYTTESQFQGFLKSISKIYKFVLVMEMFDESLVLLKRRFQWSMKDIMYLKSNVYQEKTPRISAGNLTKSDVKAFNRTYWMDIKLYKHFSEIFVNEIAMEVAFVEEVQCFKAYLSKVQEYCSSKRKRQKLHIVLEKTHFSEEFVVTREYCSLMGLEEFNFLRKLVTRHNVLFTR